MGYNHGVRVRYVETDSMGVAHHASYIAWFEEARIAWLRHVGMPYSDLEKRGVMMPVIDVHVAYKKPLFFDDVIELQTSAEVKGRGRLIFHTKIMRSEELIAEAEVTVACVNGDKRPIRIPAEIIDALNSEQS